MTVRIKCFDYIEKLQRLQAVKLPDTRDTSCTELVGGESSKRVKRSSSGLHPEDFVSKILRNVETNLSYIVENPKDFHMSNTHHENLENNNKFIPFRHLASFFRGTIYEIRPEIM
jgi:hypothetical protein